LLINEPLPRIVIKPLRYRRQKTDSVNRFINPKRHEGDTMAGIREDQNRQAECVSSYEKDCHPDLQVNYKELMDRDCKASIESRRGCGPAELKKERPAEAWAGLSAENREKK
jgi:hypothetical protein